MRSLKNEYERVNNDKSAIAIARETLALDPRLDSAFQGILYPRGHAAVHTTCQ